MQLVLGRDAARWMAGVHLLLVPEHLVAEEVVALVTARHPGAVRTPDGALRLGATRLVGPLLLDADAAAAVGVPVPWRAVWALEVPAQRGGAPLPGVGDRDGIARAFPDGLPVDDERAAVDLALALARRLDGALRVRPSGVVLAPDPAARVDRVVHSRYWLPPEQALELLAAAVPGVELATEGRPWTGLAPEAVAALEAEDAGAGLTEAQRRALHVAADARDAEATAGEQVLDAYALAVSPGAGGALRDGVVEVRVAAVEEPAEALADLPWAAAAVAYRVLWWPDDEAEAEREAPSPEHRAARAEAAALVAVLADALAGALEGVVVDAEGFPLTPVR